MMIDDSFTSLFQNVFVAALATVGIVELLKNFLKTEKKWIYALIMIPLSVGCFLASIYLPKAVIGSLLTVGIVQDCYQLLIQSIKSVIKGITEKAGGTVINNDENDNKKETTEIVEGARNEQ